MAPQRLYRLHARDCHTRVRPGAAPGSACLGLGVLLGVVDGHGVNFMATICAICKAQFSKVLPYYGFDMSMVGGVHQLVSKAIRLGEPQ